MVEIPPLEPIRPPGKAEGNQRQPRPDRRKAQQPGKEETPRPHQGKPLVAAPETGETGPVEMPVPFLRYLEPLAFFCSPHLPGFG